MKEPILVIMAAGMGSRYGGLKQMDPIDDRGNLIIDFSVYDAIKAGFGKVVFIIKKSIEKDFRENIGSRIPEHIKVSYAFQETDDLPEGFSVPEKRVKPWGTGHAVLAARDHIDGPFAVINADDYYGQEAFRLIHDELVKESEEKPYAFSMVAYSLHKTMTDFGHVARGITEVSDDGTLTDIRERTRIEKKEEGIAYTEDEGKTWQALHEDTPVSMNMWGFTLDILQELEIGFRDFLGEDAVKNPEKSEYFLPGVVNELIKKGKARVRVLSTSEKWYGMTYKEDKQSVVEAIERYRKEGKYPEELWTLRT